MADPTKGEVPERDQSAPEEETILEGLAEKLEAELKKVDPEKVKKSKVKIKEFLEGDLGWADLLDWPPEKLHETAKEGYRVYESGQYRQAEIIFKGLTVLDPENFYYHQMLAASFQQQEKLPEAIFEYSVAVDLNPEDIVSRTNRGEIYFNMKLFELAEKDFDGAIALDPHEKDRWAKRSRILKKKVRGILTTQKKKKAQARPARQSSGGGKEVK